MARTGCWSLLMAAASATVDPASAQLATWKNSTEGIHAFLTFDSGATVDAIQQYGSKIDYVWGHGGTTTKAWRKANPGVVLSKYIPYTRDPGCPQMSGKAGPQCNNKTSPFVPGCPTCLPWWKANKPDLVLYQCDRKTPAWECFGGEGCRHDSVPLDLTNPKTLEYQMITVKKAKADGYNAIALDNYGLTNSWKACGSFSGPGGAWVQKYSASSPEKDPQYTKDVLDWTKRATESIHGVGLLVIPNFSSDEMSDENFAVGNYTDGILAEGGFASWNPVPGSEWADKSPPMTTPSKFEAQLTWVRNLQQYGKGYFSINEWGAGPDYGLNPSGQPTNISGVANRPIRQFLTATFMMLNGGTLGIYLTCIQCYGGHNGGLGGLGLWPEYAAPVGTPVGEPSKDSSTGVWTRHYSASISLINPGETAQTVSLPSGSWQDLYGGAIADPSKVALAPASGLVLLKGKR